MTEKKPEVSGVSLANRKYWLVCTVGTEPYVLFTVPMKIMNGFGPECYFDLFETLRSITMSTGRDPLDFNVFRYNPHSQAFAVKTRTVCCIPAYFFDDMPWVDGGCCAAISKKLLRGIFGVDLARVSSGEIDMEAKRVGSKELWIPAPR